jgi:hypothetical protein
MRAFHASIALLLIALPAGAAGGLAVGQGALQASAAIDLRIVVPQMLEMSVLGQPATVEVTAADAANGEVVVSGPRVALLANDRRGYFIQADLVGPFSDATIEGLAAPVHVTADGAHVLMPSMVGSPRPAPYNVRYRLRLQQGAAPGTYSWPIRLSIQSP